MGAPHITTERASRLHVSKLRDLLALEKGTQTWYGRVGEVLFAYLYPDATDIVLEAGGCAPYDALHKDLGRVNVKTSVCRDTKHGKASWSFQTSSAAKSCDTIFLLGYAKDRGSIEYGWIGPASKFGFQLQAMTPTSREYRHKDYEIPLEHILTINERYGEILRGAVEKPKKIHRTRYERTLLGTVGENIYQVLHPTSDWIAQRDPTSLYDFLETDGTRVDVRTRRRGPDGRWTFFGSPDEGTDTFFFIGMDRKAEYVEAFYQVPAKNMPASGFSMRLETESKWDVYKWDKQTTPVAVRDMVVVEEFDSLTIELTSLDKTTVDGMTLEDREACLDKALKYHRRLGFPHPNLLSDEELLLRIQKLKLYQPKEGKELPINRLSGDICNPYMPHRYEARNANSDFSAFEAFHNDKRFKKALNFCLEGDRPSLSQKSVLRALTVLNRTPSNFSIAVAKALVEEYCTPGELVFDPSAGWGGRLTGTLIAGCRYFGVEPSKETVVGLHRLGTRLVEVMGLPHTSFKLLESPIQTVNPYMVPEKASFAITSPPYWDREQYQKNKGEEDEGLSLDEWVEDFLRPMFARTKSVLKVGACFAVNIVDLDKGKIPLEELACKTAQEEGFILQGSWRYMKQIYGSTRTFEPVFIFRKET